MPVVMENFQTGEEATMAPSSWSFADQESSCCDIGGGVSGTVTMDTHDAGTVSIETARTGGRSSHRGDGVHAAWTGYTPDWHGCFGIGTDSDQPSTVSRNRPASDISPTSIVAKRIETEASRVRIDQKKPLSEADVDSLKNSLKNLTKIIKRLPSAQAETDVSGRCSTHSIDSIPPPTKVRVTELRDRKVRGSQERKGSQERDLWTAMSSLMGTSPGASSSAASMEEERASPGDMDTFTQDLRSPTAPGEFPPYNAASASRRSTTTVISRRAHGQQSLGHRGEESRDGGTKVHRTGAEIRTHVGHPDVHPAPLYVTDRLLSNHQPTDNMVSAVDKPPPPPRALFDTVLSPVQAQTPGSPPVGCSQSAVNDTTAVTMPTAVSFLKTMRQAVRGLRRSAPDRLSSSPELTQRKAIIPKREVVYHYASDDDELPDLDEPLGKVCSCRNTSGQTRIMCRNCRLSPELGEPSPKKAKKDRHFLDVIPVTPVKPKLCPAGCASEKKEEDDVFDNSLPSLDSSGEESEGEETPLHRQVRGTTRNDRSNSQVDSRSVTRRSSRPAHFTIPLHGELVFDSSKSPDSSSIVTRIGDSEMNLIEGVQEEAENSENLLPQVAKLVKVFTTSKVEPPDEIVRYLFQALTTSKDCRLSYELFHTLENIVKVHPPMGSIPFMWADLEGVIERLRLPYGLQNIPRAVALSNVLALQTICSWLETELLHRSLASQLRVIKSVAYKWVSAELSFCHVKAIVQWITQAVRYGEYEDVLCSMKRLTLCGRPEGSNAQADNLIPNVLPSLQKLLDLSITVSKRPEECARRISVELVHMFHCLPSLQARRLFLTTLTSPLLKFTLTQRLLEDKCGAESCGAQCLQDILQADFRVDPPRTSLTPPPTPSSDDDDEDGGGVQNQPLYHDEGWEELLLLLWTVVSSYLATAKAKLRYPLWKRELDKPAEVLDERDKRAVKDLPNHVQRLRTRIENTSPQISTQGAMYLLKIECLSDI